MIYRSLLYIVSHRDAMVYPDHFPDRPPTLELIVSIVLIVEYTRPTNFIMVS